jgi:hypothetical protein
MAVARCTAAISVDDKRHADRGFEAVKTFSDQRTNAPRTNTVRAALLLSGIFCIFAVVCIGLLYFVGDLTRLQEAHSAKENQAALHGVNDPQQLDQALKQFPSNGVVKLVALANREWNEIDAATQARLNEAQPRMLSKPVDLTAASRSDLEALRRDLKTAESNATGFEPGYTALIKAERDKIEKDARSLKVATNVMARFMAMIDAQNKDIMDLTAKVLAARVEYYRAYDKCAELLLKEFGVYRIENGQFVFPFQYSATNYNRAAAALAGASKRIAELEQTRATVAQAQFGRWKSLVEE